MKCSERWRCIATLVAIISLDSLRGPENRWGGHSLGLSTTTPIQYDNTCLQQWSRAGSRNPFFYCVALSERVCWVIPSFRVDGEREKRFFRNKKGPLRRWQSSEPIALSLYRVDPPLSLYIWEDELKYIIGLLTTEKQVRLTSPYPFAASLFSPNIVTLHSSYLFSVRQNHVKKIYWCWSIDIRTHLLGPFSAMAGIRHADAPLNIFNFDRRY